MTRPVVRTVVQVAFGRPAPPLPLLAPTGRIPRVARLLALAHRFERMIAAGEIRDWADAARLCGVTRPRMSQVASMLLLAPAIQEAILELPPVTEGLDPITERSLRTMATEPDWERQAAMWESGSRPAHRATRRPRGGGAASGPRAGGAGAAMQVAWLAVATEDSVAERPPIETGRTPGRSDSPGPS